MRKIIIKLPDKRVNKFRLQRKEWKSRRFLRAATLLNRLENTFPCNKLEERTAIVVKEHDGIHFVSINESLPSNDSKYLLYAFACFLEDYLSEALLKSRYRKYGRNPEDRWF